MNIHGCARLCVASRALLVRRVRQERWAVTDAAEAAGISVRTAYKWLKRFREEGASGLQDRSCRPHSSPTKLPLEKADIVLHLRRTKKLTGKKIARALNLARSTVARLLRRHGLQRLALLEPRPPIQRYEWPRPGDMLHIDTKRLPRIERPGHRIHGDRTTRVTGAGYEHVHVCVDDASRVAYVELLPNDKAESATAFLERAVRWYAARGIVTVRVMTDNGSAYRSRDWAATCAQLGVRHVRTRAYTPRTNGKAERFIQSMLRECAYGIEYANSRNRHRGLLRWAAYYNERRPHCSLAGATPLTRIGAAA